MSDERDNDQGESETESGAILPFEDGSVGRLIRKQWHDDGSGARWFFSVIDVVAVLTDSPEPRTYWAVLKKRLQQEGAGETLTTCKQLKMRALDGKMRATDAADTEAMLRIVQSIPSPKAEPFKHWLARTGAQSLADAMGELSEAQRRLAEHAQLVETTDRLERTVRVANIYAARDVAIFHDEGYLGLYNEPAEAIAVRKDVPVAEITEWMGSDELSYNLFRATVANQELARNPAHTREEAGNVHFEVGQAVRQFIVERGATLPEKLPTPHQSIRALEAAERKRLADERREQGWRLEGDVE